MTFLAGQRIKNKHTLKEYTVVAVEMVDNYPEDIKVFLVADDEMNELRFNTEYMHHYELAN